MANGSTEPEEVPRRLALSFAGWLDDSRNAEKTFFEEALIVLDANVLLALYEIGADARKEVLAALTRVVSRLWVPHQAALEFCRNRKRVVRDRTGYFSDVRRSLRTAAREAIDLLEATVKDVLDLREKNRTSRPWDPAEARLDRRSLEARLAGVMDSAVAELNALEAEHDLHPKDMQQTDLLFAEIDQLLTGRIGYAPSRELLRELVDEAISFRFPNEIPPGYEDAGKRTPLIAAGDYILWREVLDRATELHATTAHVLLVTSETKPDWWLLNDRKKPLRARPELIQEMYEEAGAELLLISLADFLNGARDYLSLDVSDQTVAQLREVADSAGGHDDWQLDTSEPLDLLSLTPVQFEHLIRDLLFAMGYPEVTSSPRDYGADFEVRDTRGLKPSTLVVEAKRYHNAVNVELVRNIFGVMIHHNANGAIIVTTSWFSRSAIAFAEGKPITLIDGAKLIHLLAEHLGISATVNLNRDL
jgi:HJR/Mrr/RecB family endonuclease